MPGVLDSYKEAAAKVGFDKSSDFQSKYVIGAQNCVALVNMTTETIFGFNSMLILLESTAFVLPFSCIVSAPAGRGADRRCQREVSALPT